MAEKGELEKSRLDYETFTGLSGAEQRLLIYLRTQPENSDISLEEILDPEIVGITEKPEEAKAALDKLIARGLVKQGQNPRKLPVAGEPLPKTAAKNRFYLEPDAHEFVSKDLPRIWREKGLMK